MKTRKGKGIKLELYVHFPFCKSKCAYCDFNSYPDVDSSSVSAYIAALSREIGMAAEAYPYASVDTVYFGGGTPSMLPAAVITDIADKIFKRFRTNIKEFTIECNPESLTPEKAAAYRSAGIDRISLGVQSLSDDNLRSVGRLHNSQGVVEALETARRYFDNVSADIIVGLPYDTEALVTEEIETLSSYVTHLSVYELSLEDGTELFRREKTGLVLLPDADEVADLFETAREKAENLGFRRYEISNFARDGRISRHNYGYWTREEYIGLGAGAHSLVKTADGKTPSKRQLRFANPKDIHAYIAGVNCVESFENIPRAEISVLDEKEITREKIMLGLRTARGVEKSLLDGRVPDRLKVFFDEMENRISLNNRGMAVMNSVLGELYD